MSNELGCWSYFNFRVSIAEMVAAELEAQHHIVFCTHMISPELTVYCSDGHTSSTDGIIIKFGPYNVSISYNPPEGAFKAERIELEYEDPQLLDKINKSLYTRPNG